MTLYMLRLKALLCIVKCSCYCSGFMSELKHSKQASCYSDLTMVNCNVPVT